MRVVLDKGAFMPTRATSEAAGLDLYSPADLYLYPSRTAFIDTGVHIQLEPDEMATIRGRSGLTRRGVIVPPGTIDSDYRGSLGVVIYALEEPYHIHRGDRIAQLVVQKIERPALELVDALDDSTRGSGGFGSTGR